MLFQPPQLDDRERAVLAELDEYRTRLRHVLHEPRRWKGVLRRNLKARAIQGSNSIEGYDVSLDDALSLLDDEEPLDADRRTSLEILGYRNALTYIQQLGEDDHAVIDPTLLRSLHFMMLGHDLRNQPGRYRSGPIFVRDDDRQVTVYEGPDAATVPGLMAELGTRLAVAGDGPVFVEAALAHLNLVMIHPFKDGNGRMARALQTLVLARDRVLAPEFSSIEEWLGRNTDAYCDVLAEVGAGAWHPERDTRSWVRFTLTAHHMQAQTVQRRISEAETQWLTLSDLATVHRLPERSVLALFDAASGLRVRRSAYEREAELEPGTAARDLRLMVSAGLLLATGETRARRYSATPQLRDIRAGVAAGRPPIVDPFHGPAREGSTRRVSTSAGGLSGR